jgi:hypothetical protein
MYRHLPTQYMYYKGGGNGAMMYMMMQQQEQARQAKAEEAAREAKAAEQATQVAEEAKQQKARDIETSGQKLGRAYESALGYGKQKLSTRGIDAETDPYGIMSLYRASLDKARAGAPEIVSDPNALFSPTLLEDAMSEARTTQRGRYGQEVKNAFGTDYGLSQFGSTADDAVINALLDRQKTEAITSLDRALARGTINEIGRSSADREIENMLKAGAAKANTLGGNVLADYRNQLDTAVGKQREQAGAWDFGDTFDINKAKSSVGQLGGSLSSSLEGDILNALSGQQFFDTDLLLGKAGNATGITNRPTTTTGTGQGLTALSPVTGVTDRTKGTLSGDTRKSTSLDEVL